MSTESTQPKSSALLDQPVRSLLSTLRRRAATCVAVVSVTYCTLLAAYWILARTVGESNPTIALFLMAPPLLWGVPLALLFLPAAFLARKSALAIAAVSIVHLVGFMDYEWSSRQATADKMPRSVTVLSYNRGQHNNASLQPFKNKMAPDIIVLQDARHRAPNYQKSDGYAEYPYIVGEGEYVLLSKHPIRSTEGVPLGPTGAAATQPPPPAARFVIDLDGEEVAIYAVHLLTPRDWLRSVRRGGFLYGVLGVPGTPWAEKRRAYSKFWQQQLKATEALVSKAKLDPFPTIIAGDLNIADTGAIYRVLTEDFTDSHDEAGRGYGFTFPGNTNNPAALLEPWLRLDYILSDSRWNTLSSVTEKDRPSQHRAVAATLVLVGSPSD